MNERIKQLAEQAEVWVEEDLMFHDVLNPRIEKFAELILEECIVMADEFELDVNRSGLVDRMKNHFGVKR